MVDQCADDYAWYLSCNGELIHDEKPPYLFKSISGREKISAEEGPAEDE
jgi:hypothetical protein